MNAPRSVHRRAASLFFTSVFLIGIPLTSCAPLSRWSANLFSPARSDSRAILLRDGDIYIADFPDGTPRLLHDFKSEFTYPGEFCAINHGAQIHYTANAPEVADAYDRARRGADKYPDDIGPLDREHYLLEIKRTKQRKLFSDVDFCLRYPSPDGRWVAVLSADDAEISGPLELYGSDGGQVARSDDPDFYSPILDIGLVWSANSKAIYVVRQGIGAESNRQDKKEYVLKEYQVPSLRSRVLDEGFLRCRNLWLNPDGWLVTMGHGDPVAPAVSGTIELRALNLRTGEKRKVKTPIGGYPQAAFSSSSSDVYILDVGRVYRANWKTGEIEEIPPPSPTLQDMELSPPVGFDTVLIQGNPYLIAAYRHQQPLEPWYAPQVTEIVLMRAGESVGRTIFPGFELAYLLKRE